MSTTVENKNAAQYLRENPGALDEIAKMADIIPHGVKLAEDIKKGIEMVLSGGSSSYLEKSLNEANEFLVHIKKTHAEEFKLDSHKDLNKPLVKGVDLE